MRTTIYVYVIIITHKPPNVKCFPKVKYHFREVTKKKERLN